MELTNQSSDVIIQRLARGHSRGLLDLLLPQDLEGSACNNFALHHVTHIRLTKLASRRIGKEVVA